MRDNSELSSKVTQLSAVNPIKPPKPGLLAGVSDSFLKEIHQFPENINSDLKGLNVLIEHYLKSVESSDKLNALKAVFDAHEGISQKYSGKLTAYFFDYKKEFQDKFFNQLQAEFNQLGVTFSQKKPRLSQASEYKSAPEIFNDFIENMPLEKSAQLIAILTDKTMNVEEFTFRYTNLYKPGETGYEDFQVFLSTHDVPTLLGGVNSSNFKINFKSVDILDSSKVPLARVLKEESRHGRPTFMIDKLRSSSLDTKLTSLQVERNVPIDDLGELIMKTLIITDYCDGGDLETYLKKQTDPTARMKSIFIFYTQMAETLEQFRANDCFFSDMKNTNWVVNKEENTILIADTKALLPATNGEFNEDNDDAKLFCLALLHSHFLSPPEFMIEPCIFSVDKAHAYMFGKNLYQAMTGCSYEYLRQMKEITDKDCNHPIFETKEGLLLKYLIKSLVKPSPEDRLTMAEALKVIHQAELINDQRTGRDKLINILSIKLSSIQNQLLLKETLSKRKNTDVEKKFESNLEGGNSTR